MSSEDYQVVSKAALFLNSLREITGKEKGSHKNKKDIPLVNNYPFLIEDLCGRVEAAQKKLEQAERERERDDPSHSPTTPNSRRPANDSLINKLEAEKGQLQTKIEELGQ